MSENINLNSQHELLLTRRNFVLAAGGLGGLLSLNGLSCFGINILDPLGLFETDEGTTDTDAVPTTSEISGEYGGVITVGNAESYANGSVTYIAIGKFFLVRLDDSGFLALSERCTHLGCDVPWDADEKLFVCPCHNSKFKTDGSVNDGPARRPLSLYRIVADMGMLSVDTSAAIRRNEVGSGDAVYIA
jgi:cytochrome b6-f complex iron-sulfur subunit